MSKTTILLSAQTYQMVQHIKRVFVSYTGDDIENFDDDKIIEILASGFLGSEDIHQSSQGCGSACTCNPGEGKTSCKGACQTPCQGNCAC